MKTTINPNKSKALEPHRLRDDERWQAHYNSILTGLFARFECEDWGQDLPDAKEAFEGLSARCERLVMIAYQGACHAHAYTQIAEPYSDAELAQFNGKIGGDEN